MTAILPELYEPSAAVLKAEDEIQKILLELEQDEGTSVDLVEIDTRNYAKCAVTIFMKKATP